MPAVRVEIVRYVSPDNPGWVELRLLDASGVEHRFIEKVPVISLEDLTPDTPYPRPGVIACAVVARRREPGGREVVTVDTEAPWGVESTEGLARFEVLATQLAEP